MSEPLTLAELREVILGMRMNGFAYIDDESVIDAVRFGIQNLPSSEQLDCLADNPESLKNIGIEVGRIAQLIERGSKRDESYKVRNMARKNLPPRYQILEWRDNMKQANANLVKNIVRTSAKADAVGFNPMASHLIATAKKIMNDEDARADIIIAATYLEKAGMEKEAAGIMDYMKGFTGELGKGIGNVVKSVWQSGQAGGLEAQYTALYNQMVKFKKSVTDLKGATKDDKIRARMEALEQSIQTSEDAINKAAGDVKAVEQASQVKSSPQAQQVPTPDQPVNPQAAGGDSDLVQSLMQNKVDINSLTPDQIQRINQIKNFLANTVRKYEKTPEAKQRLQQEIDANPAAGKTSAQPVAPQPLAPVA